MKKLLTLFVFFAALFTVQAQDFIISNSTVTTCGGTFYDSGGASGSYQNFENYTYTICPTSVTGAVSLDFTFWNVESNYDDMFIYEGDDTTGDLLFSYNGFGDPGPGLIEASEGCLTILFTSDITVTPPGWAATIACNLFCQEIDLSLGSSLPIVDDTIQNCLNVSLFPILDFPENDIEYNQTEENCTYLWTVEDDPNSPYTTQNLDLELTEQGIFEISLLVTDLNECTAFSTVWVNNPSPASYVELNVAEDNEEICIGEEIAISMSLTNDVWIIPPSVVEDEPVFLDDVVGGTYTSDLVLTNYFDPFATLDNMDCITLWIDIEHTWGGDLTINLYAPNGEQLIVLEDQNGAGNGNGLGNFDFGLPVGGTTPGTGWIYGFNSAEPLTIHDVVGAGGVGVLPESDLDAGTDLYGFYNASYANILGSSLNGTWTLEIIDTWGGDDGYVFEWGIDFCDEYLSVSGTIEPNYLDTSWVVEFDGLPTNNSSIVSEEEYGLIISPEEEGDYVYTVTVIDNFGCDWTEEIDVHVFDVPSGGSDVTLTCDSEYTLQGDTDTPGGVYWTYTGPPGGIVTFSPSNEVISPDISVTTLGEYIFVIHEETCNNTDTTIVNVITAVPIIDYEEEYYCNFEIPLTVTNVVQSGVWTAESIDGTNAITFSDEEASSTTATVSGYGEYYFTYTFDFCNTSTTVHVDVLQDDPIIVTPRDTVFCSKDVMLSATVFGQEDHWEATGPGIVTFVNFESLSTEASVSEYGTYEFIYYGCGASDMIEITFSKSVPIITAPSFVECGFDAYVGFSYVGSPGSLSVSGPGNVSFDGFDSVGTTLSVDQYGEYFLTYETCETSTTQLITFMCELTVPNVFSPNNDGVNDLFKIERLNPEYYSKSYFTIYNKWGNAVYTNGNYGLNDVWWDGKNSLNGERLPDGVYYYTLELYNSVRGVEENYSGNISLFTDK